MSLQIVSYCYLRYESWKLYIFRPSLFEFRVTGSRGWSLVGDSWPSGNLHVWMRETEWDSILIFSNFLFVTFLKRGRFVWVYGFRDLLFIILGKVESGSYARRSQWNRLNIAENQKEDSDNHHLQRHTLKDLFPPASLHLFWTNKPVVNLRMTLRQVSLAPTQWLVESLKKMFWKVFKNGPLSVFFTLS